MTVRHEERAPRQDRSRHSWERVLAAGMDLFEERGWNGLTITEVCRRAQVSAPSIYARVDGKAGLFLAVHARWLAQMEVTENELISIHTVAGAPPVLAAEAAARVILGIFEAHGRALRSLIDRSAHDEALLARGAEASGHLLRRLADTIPVDAVRAEALVRAVYGECLMNVMYGPGFLLPTSESTSEFRARVITLARLIIE